MVKIVEQTDRSLHLTDQNHQSLWGLLFAAPFLLIGFGVGAATVKTTTLECQRTDRDRIECVRRVAGILGTQTDRIPGNLQRATAVKTHGTGVVLRTTTGRVELAPYRTFVTDRHFQTADRVNAFIKNPQLSNIRVEQDDRWLTLLWSGGFAIAGLVCALVALAIPTHVICRFDRDVDRAIVHKHYLLYGTHKMVFPLSTIAISEVKKLPFAVNHKALYNIALIQTGDKRVSLSIPSQDLTAYEQIVDTINHFLR